MACEHDLSEMDTAAHWDGLCPICMKAEIERLRAWQRARLETGDMDRAEIERLTAALKPFADYADPSGVFPPTIEITTGSRFARKQLTMGDCYEAARVLERKLNNEQKEDR